MINSFLNCARNVTLSKKNGRFLSDKSYGFDTVYFITKLILNSMHNNIFRKNSLRESAILYIKDIFQLTENATGAINYFYETVNLLEYANVISNTHEDVYCVNYPEILVKISERPENAYLFLYTIVYQTFKNDGLLDYYNKYCKCTGQDKIDLLQTIYRIFTEKSISIIRPESNWSKQLVKYAMLVLGFANNQPTVTRTLNIIESKLININDISLNVEGTRTPIYLPKKNDYLQTFNTNYVKHCLKEILIITPSIDTSISLKSVEDIATSLADLKLTLLKAKEKGFTMSDYETEQFIENTVRTRNQTIQRHFRKGLLENNAHCCPLCGFSFEDFLIASHIKPYAKCDDTYDAINHFNGFLMCPNHDKLFEDAKYMTIEASTGKIILRDSIRNSPDFSSLEGASISCAYIVSERRHYLKWHNQRFIELGNR